MPSKQTIGIEELPSLDDEPTATRGFTGGGDGGERDDRFDDFDGHARTAVMRKDVVLALALRTRSDGSDGPRLPPLVPAERPRPLVAAPVATPPRARIAPPPRLRVMPVMTSPPVPVETPLPPPLAPAVLPDFPAQAIEAAFAEVEARTRLMEMPAPTRRRRRILGRLALVVLAVGVLGHHEVEWPAWAQRLPQLLTSVASPSAIIGARPAPPKPR